MINMEELINSLNKKPDGRIEEFIKISNYLINCLHSHNYEGLELERLISLETLLYAFLLYEDRIQLFKNSATCENTKEKI